MEGPVPRVATPTQEEIDWILGIISPWLEVGLTRDGRDRRLRRCAPAGGPGPRVARRPPGADLSRRHVVRDHGDGRITVTGGKLTTYRRMAQDVVDLITDVPCRTARIAVVGAAAARCAGSRRPDDPGPAGPPVRQRGRRRVGARASPGPGCASRSPTGVAVLGVELAFGVEAEGALDVADLLERRTRLVAGARRSRGGRPGAPGRRRRVLPLSRAAQGPRPAPGRPPMLVSPGGHADRKGFVMAGAAGASEQGAVDAGRRLAAVLALVTGALALVAVLAFTVGSVRPPRRWRWSGRGSPSPAGGTWWPTAGPSRIAGGVAGSGRARGPRGEPACSAGGSLLGPARGGRPGRRPRPTSPDAPPAGTWPRSSPPTSAPPRAPGPAPGPDHEPEVGRREGREVRPRRGVPGSRHRAGGPRRRATTSSRSPRTPWPAAPTCSGMAGGDGSQALVATVAMKHGLPHVVVPAGTRNHLALDLGLDRDDVVGALDAFGSGIPRTDRPGDGQRPGLRQQRVAGPLRRDRGLRGLPRREAAHRPRHPARPPGRQRRLPRPALRRRPRRGPRHRRRRPGVQQPVRAGLARRRRDPRADGHRRCSAWCP